MCLITKIINGNSYNESDGQDFEYNAFDGKWKSNTCVFYKWEHEKISEKVNSRSSEKMLERVFRGLVEKDKENKEEREHAFYNENTVIPESLNHWSF